MSSTHLIEKEILNVVEMPIESIKKISKNQILIAHRNKAVCLYQLSENPTSGPSICLKAYKHKSLVSDVCYADAGEKILSVSNQSLCVFDKDTKEASEFKGHKLPIVSVAINKDNNKIVTGSQDGTFVVWNTNGEQKEKLGSGEFGHSGWINIVEFVPESAETLATASEDGSVKIWNLETNELLKTFIDGHYVNVEKLAEQKQKVKANTELAVKAMCFSNDGSLMAYGGRNGKVYIINLSNNEALQIFDVPDRITALASGETQPMIAVAIPNKILLWNIIENEIVAEYALNTKNEVYCYSMVFSGDELIVGFTNGKVLRLEIMRK